jgi:YbbR domain-containing protein
MWGLHALRKTYETVIHLPVEYVGLPKEFTQTGDLPNQLEVTVSDRGVTLFNYRFIKHFSPVSVQMENISPGDSTLRTKTLQSLIQEKLSAGTQILDIKPELLNFTVARLHKKELPVKLDHRIELFRQYTLRDSIDVIPSTMVVYAPEAVLDTMRFVYTEPLVIKELKDSVRREVKLKEIKGLIYDSPAITAVIRTELFTEKTVNVPLQIRNVPEGYIIRIFPSTVNVSFQLGLSLYDKINRSDFVLIVDFDEARNGGKSKTIPVKIEKQPEKIFNVKINPKSVDYLIEEK